MNYIEEAKRTEPKYEGSAKRLSSLETIRLLHGTMGAATEAAEALDMMKKHIFYGKEIDLVNLKEEIGDLFWYAAILCDQLGISFGEAQAVNIDKLRARFPEKFEEMQAINRDTATERKILENSS